jgi:[ribosomal protein S18]-alanine N-acetyltransferase
MFWNELANGHHYLVATEDDQIIGYAGLSVNGTEAWIQNLAVRRDRQRGGVGRSLLEAMLAEAVRKGATAVLLEVAVDNGPAQRLYDQYGFQPVGMRRGYYQPSNTDALVMRKELSP